MTVIAVTGHQHIPEQANEYVTEELRRLLDTYQGLEQQITGVSCLAVGADQLFADEVLNRGFALKAIIPCANYESTFNARDLKAYRRLLREASSVETMPYTDPTPHAFLEASKHMIDMSDIVVALWDGFPGQPGGTGDAVSYARSQGKPMVMIWPEGVLH